MRKVRNESVEAEKNDEIMQEENVMERLRELRKERNLSQKMVGDELGIAQQTLSRYEKNINTVPVDVLIKLAKYYSVTTDYILGISQIKNSFKKQSAKSRNQEFLKIYKVLNQKNKELLWTMATKMQQLEK